MYFVLFILIYFSEYYSEDKVIDAFQCQIAPSMASLRNFDVSVDQIQEHICREYKSMEQLGQAELIIEYVILFETYSRFYSSFRFIGLMETSPMYGSYYYHG